MSVSNQLTIRRVRQTERERVSRIAEPNGLQWGR